MKYAWIKQHQKRFPIKLMCHVLNVSPSGYYDHFKREPSARAVRHQKIRQTVRTLYENSRKIYGSYKIAEVMKQRDDLDAACRNTVAAAMRELGLKSRVCKAYKPTTTKADPSRTPAANVLDRDFTADQPNQKWVTDITYIRVAGSWVYLSAVMDLFSRKIVGWSIGDTLSTQLVSDALRQAIETRRPSTGLLHHSDRGCQYTSDQYQKTLATLGIVCSMSRTGDCYDNSVMERFFWSLKHEWTNHERYDDLPDARISVFKYIETFYNTERIHQTLGYQTPEAFEDAFEQSNPSDLTPTQDTHADHAPATNKEHVA